MKKEDRRHMQVYKLISIEFHVQSADIVLKLDQYRNWKNKLQSEIASLIGIDSDLIEMMKPTQIKQGLKVVINFHISNSRAIDGNIEKNITDAQNSGQIANIMRESWNLSSAPMIKNVKYLKYNHKERRDKRKLVKFQVVNSISNDGNMLYVNNQMEMSELNENIDQELNPGDDRSNNMLGLKEGDNQTNIELPKHHNMINPLNDEEIFGDDEVTEGIKDGVNNNEHLNQDESEDGSYHSSQSDLAYERYAMVKRTSCFLPDPDKDKYNDTATHQ